MEETEVREQIAIGFEYSYRHDDWITPLDECLEGLSPADALYRITSESKCIWEIVLHLAVWNQNIIDRIRTREISRPKEGSWPPLPTALTDAEWRAAKRRLSETLE